jgi:SAM-dependent methyltransferase
VTHDHHHDADEQRAAPDQFDWDEMYTESEQIWSGDPNGVLVAEVTDLAPGTAVDVGCGEGADAIWLARQGWRVTAFDVSAVALGRAERHIAAADVTVELRRGPLLEVDLTGAPYDLVNVQYPALAPQGGRSLAALLDLVAAGGTLLFVHHVVDAGQHRGFDPADYLMPPDVRAALGDGWEIQVDEQRPRHVTTGAGAGHAVDQVLRARRLPTG